jgi:hypothetical protein
MTDQASHALSRTDKELREFNLQRQRERTKARNRERDKVMRQIFSEPGYAAVVARHLGVTHQNVSQWNQVPPHHVHAVAELLKKQPYQIRPDIFMPPKRSKT